MQSFQKSEFRNINNIFYQKLHKGTLTHTRPYPPTNYNTHTRFSIPSKIALNQPHIVYHTSFNAFKPGSSLLASSFLYTLSKYEKSAKRTSTPQERRQRAHEHSNRIHTLSSHPSTESLTLHCQKKERREKEEEKKKKREKERKKWMRRREEREKVKAKVQKKVRTDTSCVRSLKVEPHSSTETRTQRHTNNHTGSTGQPNKSASTSNHKIATQFKL